MKIAIDCADLDHARIDGTRVYIKNVLNWLGRLDPQSSFYLYHQTDFQALLAPQMYPNYIERKIPFSWVWTQTKFAQALFRDQPAVCWMPIQQLPFVRSRKTKFVITIHDLAFKIFPKQFPLVDRMKLNLFADHAITHADHIIAVSESTKQDILRFYPTVPEQRVTVIYHGFDPEIFQQRYTLQEIAAVLAQYNILPQIKKSIRYILYVGAIQPRKNLISLIRAFEVLQQNPLYDSVRLVMVGESAWQAQPTLQAVEQSPTKEKIILTGRVSFEELAKLYQGADVFVMPSQYEGFGIPVLEAFASQTPVIVADNSSLSEIAADAAARFDANDPNALLDALQRILQDDTLKADLIQRGLRRVDMFSWQRCATQTLEVFTTVTKQA